MFPTKLLETDSMRVTICSSCPLVEPVLTALHCVAQLVFSREHQNWQLYHRCPVLFTQRVWTPVPNAALIFLVAFHYDALRGSDSTDSTDYGHTKSFQENFLEMSQNCIFKWHLEHKRLKPSSQQTFPWSWLMVLKMNLVFLGYSWERAAVCGC